jgi:hypothetical protein
MARMNRNNEKLIENNWFLKGPNLGVGARGLKALTS